MKIKILRIIARLNIGGPAIHAILLSAGLDKDVFETRLICGISEKREGNMLELAEQKGVEPIVIPELGRGVNMRNDIIALWKLFCLIRREKPDIIHTHTAKAGTLGRLAGILYNLVSGFWFLGHPKRKCILIHTFHGHVLHSYFGRSKSAIFTGIEIFLAVFTDRIIAISEKLREELIDLRIAGPRKIIVVPLGLELENCLEIERNGSEHKDYRTIGIIGRLVPVKNHEMFLDVARRLKDTAGIGQMVKFLIVGDGALRRELECYADRLGILEDVIFTGWIKDLRQVYSQLDIAALTSLNEGTPVALIEAQAAACPCVATDVGGVANVVDEGKGGFLVASGDTEEFVRAITKLLRNPELMKSMGEYGRQRVKNRFNKSRLIKDIESLYDSVVKL